MTTDKGYTLGAFGQFLLCVGQSQVDALGYSALPINLVEDAFTQLQKIPGNAVPAQTQLPRSPQCNNPTFSTNGTNTLAVNDPQPLACDKQGTTQCAAGRSGADGKRCADRQQRGGQRDDRRGTTTTGPRRTDTGGHHDRRDHDRRHQHRRHDDGRDHDRRHQDRRSTSSNPAVTGGARP